MHAVTSLRSKKSGGPWRVPMQLAPDLIFENYDDSEFGYLRIVANNEVLQVRRLDLISWSDAPRTLSLQSFQVAVQC